MFIKDTFCFVGLFLHTHALVKVYAREYFACTIGTFILASIHGTLTCNMTLCMSSMYSVNFISLRLDDQQQQEN